MIFKMMMDASGEDEKPVVRGYLKHLVLGFAGGVAVGSILLGVCCYLSRIWTSTCPCYGFSR